MTRRRQLHLGAILEGVATDQHSWRDPALPGDASIDINWYIDHARLAEAAKFDLVFIVDSPLITPDTAPHFLNRLEPTTFSTAPSARPRHAASANDAADSAITRWRDRITRRSAPGAGRCCG